MSAPANGAGYRRLFRGASRVALTLLVVAFVVALPGGTFGERTPVHAIGPTDVCGTLTADTTWSTVDSPFIATCNVTVNPGVNLTIEPGVEVLFNSGLQLNVSGGLVAAGEAGGPIYLGPNHPTPTKGTWRGIRLTANGATVSLSHTIVRYAGTTSSPNYAAIDNYSGSTPFSSNTISIANSTIEHNAWGGIRVGGNANLSIANSTVSDSSTYGVYVDSSAVSISGSSISNNYTGPGSGNGFWGASLPSFSIANTTFSGNGDEAARVQLSGASSFSFSGNVASGNGSNALSLYGSLASSVTLAANPLMPYRLTSGLTIPAGTTTTIPAGAIFKLSGFLSVLGILDIQGTAANPVYLTAFADDSVAGDTNGDGSTTSPAKGHWSGIRIAANNASLNLSHTILRYAGSTSSPYYHAIDNYSGSTPFSSNTISIANSTIEHNAYGGVRAGGNANLSIANSTVSDSSTYGVKVDSSAVSISDSSISNNYTGPGSGNGFWGSSLPSFSITNTTFSGNGDEAARAQLSGASSFVFSGNVASGNGSNALSLYGSLATSVTLAANPLMPYRLTSGLTIPAGTTTTIPAGAIFKSSGFLSVLGTLDILGTAANPVYLTAFADDSIAGDTNGDGSTTPPAKGQWSGIRLSANSASVSLVHTILRYAGDPNSLFAVDNYQGNVTPFSGNTISIANSTIEHNAYGGVRAGGNANLSIANSTISDSSNYGVYVNSSVATISGSSIVGHSSYGVIASGGAIPNAENNWWGDPSGPAPYGAGNAVNNVLCAPPNETQTCTLRVDVEPWLTTEPDLAGGNSYSITGTVVDGNADPLSGVVMSLSNGMSTTTNVTGTYLFAGLAAGSYTLTPSKSGLAFSPASVNIAVAADVTGIDFVATAVSGTQAQTTFGGPAWNPFTPHSYDPVNLATGNYTYQHVDVLIPARGIDLQFVRSYNSLSTASTRLGTGWQDNWGARIVFDDEDPAIANPTVVRETGRHDAYTREADGTYTPPVGVFDTLIRNVNGTFTLRLKDKSELLFDPSGVLTSVSDRNGNSTYLTYVSGQLVSVTAGGGRSLTFAYDNAGRITTVTDPAGRTAVFGYDAENDLISFTDQAGGVTTYTYDGEHRMLTIVDPRGNTVMTNVYAGGKVVSQSNALSHTWTFSYATGETVETDPLGCATTYSYDALHRQTEVTDCLSGTSAYTYDSAGNRTSVTDVLGRTTTYTYDARGNVLSVTNPLGGVATFTYSSANDLLTATDELGRTTSYIHDTAGNVVSTIDAVGEQTTYAYDAYGNLISTTNALGHTATAAFNSSGDMVSATNAAGETTSSAVDAVGRVIGITDPMGRTTTYSYDDLDRLLTTTDPMGHALSFAYDANGNEVSFTDANGSPTVYTYDALNRLIATTDPGGAAVAFAYDPAGNRISKTDGNGNVTTYGYDLLGRLTSSTDPVGQSITWIHDALGNATSRTDGNGHTTFYVYDGLGRLTAIDYADQRPVSYAYDAVGNRVSMTDTTGTTSYVYDDMNRLTSVAFSGSQVVTYEYDVLGQLTALGYPDGKISLTDFDAAGRLASVSDWAGRFVDYEYNTASDIATVSRSNGVTSAYAYDGAGRLNSISHADGPTVLSQVDYDLDDRGNRTSRTTAAGIELFTYDALHRLTSASHPIEPTTSFTYDPTGNRLTATPAGGTTVAYAYNDADQLLTAGTASASFDANGNLTRSGTRYYSYDREDRLLRVVDWPVAPAPGTKCGDANGDGATDVLDLSLVASQWGRRAGISATYSPATDINADGITNVGDLLIVAENYGLSCTLLLANTFNGDGLRIHRWQDGSAERFTWDVARAVPVILQSSNGTTFLWGASLLLADANSSATWFHQDGQGSTVLTTDSTGTVVDTYEYDAFGAPRGEVPAFGYNSQQHDNAGVIYLRARFYDPSTGRFLTRDPVAGLDTNSQTLNAYPYGGNNPLVEADPTGEAFWIAGSAAAGAIIGGSSGAISYVIWSAATGDEITVRGVVAHSLGGAVGGAVQYGGCAATGPIGCAVSGAAGGAASSIVTSFIAGDEIRLSNVAISAAVGLTTVKQPRLVGRPPTTTAGADRYAWRLVAREGIRGFAGAAARKLTSQVIGGFFAPDAAYSSAGSGTIK